MPEVFSGAYFRLQGIKTPVDGSIGGMERLEGWVDWRDGSIEGSHKEFVGVGDEIEEGLKIRLVFPFVQFVIEGSFFGVGFILFFLLD